MSYKKLEIYQNALNLFVSIHKFSLLLPNYEKYELGSQIRRSADSVVSNIVEGYGRKKYKAEFLKFLIYANSSCDETKNHLEKIGLIYEDKLAESIEVIAGYEKLGRQIFRFSEFILNQNPV